MTRQQKIAMIREYSLAVLLPFAALALQWLLWSWVKPFVWFFFFPAVFISARRTSFLGGSDHHCNQRCYRLVFLSVAATELRFGFTRQHQLHGGVHGDGLCV